MFIPDEKYIKYLSQSYTLALNFINQGKLSDYFLLLEEDSKPVKDGFLVKVAPFECAMFDPRVTKSLNFKKVIPFDKFKFEQYIDFREIFSKGIFHSLFNVAIYMNSDISYLPSTDSIYPFINALKDRIKKFNKYRQNNQYIKDQEKQLHKIQSISNKNYLDMFELVKKFEKDTKENRKNIDDDLPETMGYEDKGA